MADARTLAYRKERREMSGEKVDFVGPVMSGLMTAVAGLWIFDSAEAISNVKSVNLGLTVGIGWALAARFWNYLFVAPKKMHFRNLAAIKRLEDEKDFLWSDIDTRVKAEQAKCHHAMNLAVRREAALNDEVARLKASTQILQSKTASTEWLEMSDRFKEFDGGESWALWQRSSRTGEKWWFRGRGGMSQVQAEILCRRAAAMLLASPRVSAKLSDFVRGEQDPLVRWLKQLRDTYAPDWTHSVIGVDDEHADEKLESASIDHLTEKSAALCLLLSAEEI